MLGSRGFPISNAAGSIWENLGGDYAYAFVFARAPIVPVFSHRLPL
jgi:hypothetical protein